MTNKTWNIILWVLQILLGGLFLMAGFFKTVTPISELAVDMPWVNDVGEWLVRTPAIAEVLGGLGLILPSALRIQPKLTVWAAYGLLGVMIAAAGFHMSRGEYEAIGTNFLLGGLAYTIAWGRNNKAPITAR
ncbi:MAG: DoxX family protein [Bacteroidota bacterium]